MNKRGNQATHSKESILAHAKNLLRVYLPAMQRMPKIERWDGAAPSLRQAAFDIIDLYTVAWNCPEARLTSIQRMFGAYGRLIAAFELLVQQGLLTAGTQLAIAEQLERMEEGIAKWHHTVAEMKQKDKALASGAGAGQKEAPVGMEG